MKNHFLGVPAMLTVWLCAVWPAQAQWLTQTNVIPPGWSAVYLNVDASGYGQTIDQLVGSDPANPIVEIWLWRAAVSPAQYVSTPQDLLSDGSHWIKWLRNASATPNELQALVGNSAYLIHSSSPVNYTWRVQGRPVPPSYLWDITGLNLIGFSTPAANPPNFQNFLAPVPAFANTVQLYQYVGGPLVAYVNPAPVFSQFTTAVTRGQAFWVRATNANNTYFGPFTVTLPNPSGIAYGTAGGQVTLHLYNTTSNALTVSARMLNSEPPACGQTNTYAGPPPLLLRGAPNNSTNAAGVTYAFTALTPDSTLSWTLAPSGQPNSDQTVVLGVNAYALSAAAGSLYAGILQFTDSLGFSEIDVPVTAQSASTAGLWVGSASVSQVGSYLKTYATNADGSTMMHTATNYLSVTNPAALLATNFVIFNAFTNSQTIYQYTITNLVVNTYTTNQLAVVTNGMVLSTNEAIQTFVLTNTVITTTPTVPYFSGGLLYWQTANVTNISGSAYATTNWLVLTNPIAAVGGNGAPVLVTNLISNFVLTTNLLTTNGIFMTPVTLQTLSGTNLTWQWISTNPAYAVLVTNSQTLTSATSSLTVTQYTVTNPIVSTGYASTNYYVTNQPLAVVTNPPNWIVIFQTVNVYALTNLTTIDLITNGNVISNSYVLIDGATNFLGGVTNQPFSNGAGSTTATAANYATTNLDYFFLPLAVVSNTPVLVTNAGSYVVTSLNTNLGAVQSPYPLRLILHNDGATCRLLQRVYYGLRQQTNIVVATTESVLDPATLDVARRISATQLPWSQANTPWTCSGSLALGRTLQVTVTDAYDDQTSNPFLHTYHPDHNNLSDPNPENAIELLPGKQSYNITRDITLTFGPSGSDFGSLVAATASLSGIYGETLTLGGYNGNQRTFTTAGTFSLTRISPIATLTTQ